MKRGMLIGWIAVLLCVSIAYVALAALAEDWNPNAGTPLVSSAWVYAEPKPDAGTVGQIFAGQGNYYDILEIKNGWTRVALHDGATGWTPQSAIDYADAIPPEVWSGAVARRRAVVLCEGLSLRDAPSGSAKRQVLMPNGSHAYILEEGNGWLRVHYLARDKKNNAQSYTGWIQQEYTVESPAYIHLQRQTRVYAFGSSRAPVVALTPSSGQRFAVIGQVGNYYVVSIRSASGFIRHSAPVWTEREVIEGLK